MFKNLIPKEEKLQSLHKEPVGCINLSQNLICCLLSHKGKTYFETSVSRWVSLIRYTSCHLN